MANDKVTQANLSRRGLLKLGAAVGAAAGAASLGLGVTSVGAATNPSTPGFHPTGPRTGPKIAIKTPVPANSVSNVVGVSDFSGLGGTLTYDGTTHGVYTTGGFTTAALNVPPGATFKVLSGFGTSTGATGQDWSLWAQDSLNDTFGPIAGPTNPGASGRQFVTLGVDYLVAPYVRLVVQVIPSADASNTVSGIGYWYVPASPAFNVIAPQRVYDSRLSGGKIAPGATRTVSVATSTHSNPVVPSLASAVFYNLTVVGATGGGYLALFPTGTTWPGNSSINWVNGSALANGGVVALGGDRQVNVFCNGTATHFLIDITGYYL
jgi:hypothetical protein